MQTVYKTQRLGKEHWGVMEIPASHHGERTIVSVHNDKATADRETRQLRGDGARPLGRIIPEIVRGVRHG